MKILKQRNIDNGQIGKFILVFGASTFPFSVLSLIFSFGAVYKLELYKYVTLELVIVISAISYAAWLWIVWVFVLPSMQKGGNEQMYKHDNPMKIQLDRIEKDIKELKNK